MYAKAAGLLALASGASATIKGWNYGNMFSDNSAKMQSDYESEFTTAQGLVGATDFTSARLYTMVQAYTTSDPIQAIPAAIKTKTGLLLTLWASGDSFSNELTALKSAISTYGSDLGGLVQGISIGSEDLYRISPIGIENESGVGQSPDTLVDYIKQVRSAISGTALSAVPVGHVDTWTAWVNSSNDAVIDNCDWIGVDSYPYFQNTMSNSIDDAASLMSSAISETKSNVGSKPIWITETGWPVSGKTENLAVPSTVNAKTYWDNVGCDLLFGVYNTWWYTLQDAEPTTPNPSFGVIGSTLTTTPLYDLSCSNKTTTSSSTSSASSTATSSAGGSSTTLTSVQATSTSTGSSGSSGSGESSGTGSGSSGSSGSTGESSGSSSSGSSSSGSSSGSSTGASGTGSVGSGSNSTVTTGSPTGSSSGSSSSSGASSGSSHVATSGASTTMKSGAYGAAFLAIMAAIFSQ